jgi:uncharacterized protein
MPEYPHGTPSWIELDTTDGDAARSFYGQLFEWTVADTGTVEETGGYQMFQSDGKSVAGLMAQADLPYNVWATYISVDDADEAAANVTRAGGQVVLAPMDVMEIGRMGVFSDPAGAHFGVWQAGSFAGAELVAEPGSLCWSELLCRDAEAAKRFYPEVFGWTAAPFAEVPGYTLWQIGDRPVGGLLQMTDENFPSEVPPHWSVVFAVADTDATVAKATELGGTVLSPPMDIPPGRFAVLADAQGTAFQVIKQNPM